MRRSRLLLALAFILALSAALVQLLAPDDGERPDDGGARSEAPAAEEPAAEEGVELPRVGAGARTGAARTEPSLEGSGAEHAARSESADAASLSGIVLGPDGGPCDGATVSLAAVGAGDDAPALSARSAEDGQYAIDRIPPGVYRVEARAPGLRPDLREAVAIAPGEALRLDLALATGSSIPGRVIAAADGRAVPRAVVRAYRSDAFSGRRATLLLEVERAEPEASAVADEEGRFELQGLTAGPKLLLGRASGFRTSPPVEADAPAEGQGAPVTLELDPGMTIAGRVLRAADKQPVAGARVEAEEERRGGPFGGLGGGGGGAEGGEAVTDADGRFEISGVYGRRFRLLAWPSSESGLGVGVRGGVRPGQTDADIELPAGGRLAGVVVDAGSKDPIAGATVDIGVPGTRKSTTTDAAGEFAFDALPPVGLTLRARAPGRAMKEQPFKPTPGDTRLVIELSGGAIVEGRVVEEGTGAPIQGAVVRAIRAAA